VTPPASFGSARVWDSASPSKPNGRARRAIELFHQTMTHEWAQGRRYETSDQRIAALAAWLHRTRRFACAMKNKM
jgi:hypothetical protein